MIQALDRGAMRMVDAMTFQPRVRFFTSFSIESFQDERANFGHLGYKESLEKVLESVVESAKIEIERAVREYNDKEPPLDLPRVNE